MLVMLSEPNDTSDRAVYSSAMKLVFIYGQVGAGKLTIGRMLYALGNSDSQLHGRR